MNTRIIFKDEFAVIGKMGEGSVNNPHEWISPLWETANTHFSEITGIVRHNQNGDVIGIWGAMNDCNEKNRRWGERGKYMAACEADVAAEAPEGWSKWVIPAQTYLIEDCTMDTYGEVFEKITNDPEMKIIGTVHERYPQPDNPNILELWFPIADGMMFCQSCGMPLAKEEDLGTEIGGNKSTDYCRYCYENGRFHTEGTMEQMIDTCVPFMTQDGKMSEAQAREILNQQFPKLKRWKRS